MTQRILLVLAAAWACSDPAEPPLPTAASVTVTSAVNNILAAGRTSQLTGAVLDASGNPLSATLTWSSSNNAVVSVAPGGLATAAGVGTAVVTASTGSVSGTLELRVVNANLAGVTTLAGDPYTAALLNGLTTAKKNVAQPIAATCAASATSGNVTAISTCVTGLRAEAASATDPTDRALLAVLMLIIDEVERRLGL
jgi:hypothetical protein